MPDLSVRCAIAMRIGDQSNYLRIEARSPDDPYTPMVMEAVVESGGASFRGMNDAVMFSVDDELRTGLKRFEEFVLDELTVKMTEGCHLVLKRDVRGNILVNYRISHWKFEEKTALEGVVQVDGEWGQAFCQDLKQAIGEI